MLWRAPDFASTRHSRWARPILIGAAARCSCGAARAAAAERSEWTSGPGSSSNRGLTSAPRSRSDLFCIVTGATRGRAWSNTAVRAQLRDVAAQAGVRRRFAPHRLRHAHAVEMAREGVPLIVIQRQLGHTSLGVTSIYLQGIDSAEIIDAVHARRAPMIPVDTSLLL